MPDNRSTYTGRFAPSPTGPLHLGSLVSALASYLDARAHRGRWLLRMEDIDPPREVAGASERIISSLRNHGLRWDGDITWQSQRGHFYDAALQRLQEAKLAFYCRCSRKQLAKSRGLHRSPCPNPGNSPPDTAIRLRVDAQTIGFEDGIQGAFSQHLRETAGDFVLRRRDSLYAYQLAVVVDDAVQGITHIVRGSDLLDSTPRQIFLQQQLAYPTPAYLHVPVITGHNGNKLSKQNFAAPLDDSCALDNLRQALRLLRQPEIRGRGSDVDSLLGCAVENWDRTRIPRQLAIGTSDTRPG